MSIMYGWTAHFEETGLRLWSGDQNATIGGEVYQAGGAIAITSLTDERGGTPERATATFQIVDTTLRTAFLQDLGPALFTLRYVASVDQGMTWHFLPRQHRGRLSATRMVEGVFEAELEKATTLNDRATPRTWSDQAHKSRHGGDKFFEYTASLAVGGRESRWPT